MAVARYRERHSVSRKKSDHVDAMTLANILRTDAHMHRPLPADTELARAIAVLARAHQDATWRRSRAGNELRSLLREYHPGFLAAFAGGNATNLATADARAVLAIAPTPAAAAKLTKARVAAALRRGGRKRGVDKLAERLHQDLRRAQLRQDPMVEEAMGAQALRLLATLNTECDSVDQLGQAVAEAFATHPDHKIITSFTGLGDLTGARVLAEIGDDRSPLRRCQIVEGLRRLSTDHQSVGPQPVGHPTAGEEQPPRGRRVRLGVRRRHPLTRRQHPVLPAPRARRPPRRRTAQRVQPPHRLPLPLPADRPDLRRDHGLSRTAARASEPRRLTVSKIGGLWMVLGLVT